MKTAPYEYSDLDLYGVIIETCALLIGFGIVGEVANYYVATALYAVGYLAYWRAWR